METAFLGEYIKQRRQDLGLTQAQVCEGICESMTMSRLERGKQAPSYHNINAILERLGLPGSRYFALLSKNEVDVEALKKDIRADVILFERAAKEERSQIRMRALTKIKQLEQLSDADDRVTQQYILSTKASLGKPEGPYSFDERLNMLMEAIKLTVPHIDLDKINMSRYSIAETTILNQIARTYSVAEQRKKAIDIYSQLLKYVEKNDQELPRYAGHFCLVAHNYARDLASEKRYKEAVEIAERGKQTSTKYGDYQCLPTFLAILAECYYFIGERAKSAKLYMQACYLYEVVGDRHNFHIIQQEMEDRLGLKIPY